MANDKCVVCLDAKTDPVAIPCGHTLCRICYESYRTIGKGTTCPLCRSPFVSNIEQDSEFDILSYQASLEEADRISEEMVHEGFQQDVSLIDGLFEAEIDFDEPHDEEYEEEDSINSQGPFESNIEQDSEFDILSYQASLEEADRISEEMVHEGFQQDVSLIDGLFEAEIDFDEPHDEEYEEEDSINSQGPFVSNIEQDSEFDILSYQASLEEADRISEEIEFNEMVHEGFQQDVSFIDGLFEAEIDFDEPHDEEYEEGDSINSQSEVGSLNPFEEEEEKEEEIEMESEDDSLDQMEIDVEIETESSDNDEFSQEMF